MITRLVVGGAQTNTVYTVKKLDRGRYEVAVLSGPSKDVGGGELVSGVKQAGIPFTEIPELITPVHPYKDLLALVKLYRFFKTHPFDIVHTHGSKAGILGRWAARAAGVPIVVHTVHGWSFNDFLPNPKKRLFLFLERLTAPFTDRFIVVTHLDIQKGLRQAIGKADDYVTVRSGIDVRRFMDVQVDVRDKKQELGVREDWPMICMVGRLSDQKAPQDFVKACHFVARRHPHVSFLLVGDGPLRPEVERLARELGIAEEFVITGIRNDVHEILSVADVLALSSLWEGLPRIIPEGMAAGKPLVITAVDGSKEGIVEGVTGFLVPPREPKRMAEKIVQLLEDRELAKRMGEEGKRRVYPEFCVDHMVKRIEQVYEELLQKKQIGKALAS